MFMHPRNWKIAALLGAAAICMMFAAGIARAQVKPLLFSVVPQFPAAEIHSTWTPLLRRLEEQVGAKFELVIAASIPDFEQSLFLGQPDFAFLNPYHMVLARRAQGYVPMVRDNEKMLTGILVVPRDGPVKQISDLQGRTLAFPAPNAFGASLYLRALLAERHKLNIRPNYVKTHSNAYRHVLTGEAAAAGGIRVTLDHEAAEVRDRLRVLYETPASAPHPVAAHPRVPVALREKVASVILNIAREENGAALLKAIQMPQPIAADYRRDYQALQELGLERYLVLDGPAKK
jgi:phosphonate transport system substrate-binding protein